MGDHRRCGACSIRRSCRAGCGPPRPTTAATATSTGRAACSKPIGWPTTYWSGRSRRGWNPTTCAKSGPAAAPVTSSRLRTPRTCFAGFAACGRPTVVEGTSSTRPTRGAGRASTGRVDRASVSGTRASGGASEGSGSARSRWRRPHPASSFGSPGSRAPQGKADRGLALGRLAGRSWSTGPGAATSCAPVAASASLGAVAGCLASRS